jgi:RHS repeat-associated protein
MGKSMARARGGAVSGRHLPTVLAMLAWALLAAGPSAAQDVVEYYQLDSVGNVLVVTNAQGAVVEEHDYLPFGEELCGTVPCSAPTAGQPRRFTGKERDAETGLDYFGARYYQAKHARFTTVDPVYTCQENLVDPQRWNRYAYARNNPLRYTDPDGRVIFDFQEFTTNLQLATQFGENKAGYLVPSLAVLAVAGSIAGDITLATAGVKLVQGVRAGLAVGAADDLAARAKDIHGLVGQVTQDKTTVAAARVLTSEGAERTIIASSERVLRPAQRAALKAGEEAAKGAGHAEVTAINAAKAAGHTVTEVAASRPICPTCAGAIRQAGAKVGSALKETQ